MASTDFAKKPTMLSNTSSLSLFNKVTRLSVLFALGSSLGIILNILHMDYKSNMPDYVYSFICNTWPAIFFCGLAAVYIGYCYPFFDHTLGECHHNDREAASIVRGIAFFFGLNHLCSKLIFDNWFHFCIILILACILFWYWFDQTKVGLLFNTTNSIMVIILTHILNYFGTVAYNEPKFNYVLTCLTCLVFSGGIIFGNIGRQFIHWHISICQHETPKSMLHHHHND